jgi:hypothetical protein
MSSKSSSQTGRSQHLVAEHAQQQDVEIASHLESITESVAEVWFGNNIAWVGGIRL